MRHPTPIATDESTTMGGTPVQSVNGALAFGDSVLWGQGLRHENKFITRIANNTLSLAFPPDSIHAHSGAIVGNATDVGQTELAPDNSVIHPEVPQASPSIFSQINSFGRDLPPNQTPANNFQGWCFPNVSAVFLNGGINDMGASNLVTANFGTLHALEQTVNTFLGEAFGGLLDRVRQRFPNALIMAFGYHFIFSHLSLRKVAGFVGGLEGFISGLPNVEARLIREQFRRAARQGSWFMSVSHAEHQRAIDEFNLVDLANDRPGCLYVPSLHGPEHAAFAPESLSWDIGRPASISSSFLRIARRGILDADFGLLSPFGSTDEVAAERAVECDISTNGVGQQATCKMAGLFHPNSRSAERVSETADLIHGRFVAPPSMSETMEPETSLARYAARRGFGPGVSYRQMYSTDIIGSIRFRGTIETGSSGDFPYHLMYFDIESKTEAAPIRLPLNTTLPFSEFFKERNKDLFPGAAGPLLRVGDIATVRDVTNDTGFNFFAYPTTAVSVHDITTIVVGCDEVDGSFNITVRNPAIEINGRDMELDVARFILVDGRKDFLYFG